MISTQYKAFLRIHLENTFKYDNFLNDFFVYYDCSKINVLSFIDFYNTNKQRINVYIENKNTFFDNEILLIILYFLTFKKEILINNWFLNENYLQTIVNKW